MSMTQISSSGPAGALASPAHSSADLLRQPIAVPEALRRSEMRITVKKGRTIFNHGDPAEKVYRVVSGIARLCRHMPDGRRQIVRLLLPGNFFAVESQGHYSFSAESVQNCVLSVWGRRPFDEAMQFDPAADDHVRQQMLRQVLEMEDHVLALGRYCAIERIASFLLYLHNRMKVSGDTLEFHIDRVDIADYLGLTIETISRNLTQLGRERLLEVVNGGVRLLNLDGLRTIAAGNPAH